MRVFLKKWLTKAVQNDLFWGVIKPVALFGVHCQNSRNSVESDRSIIEAKNHFNSDHILNGPFKGMKYPIFEAIGSSYDPKILGSYEAELWGVMEYLKTCSFDEIHDIGCAEGYYANGLALHLPLATVYAYDIELKAQELCLQIATSNQITNLHVSGEVEPFSFARKINGKKCLVISDCEGFEKKLFEKQYIESYSKSHLVIEMHDFLDVTISDGIKSVLSHSHWLISIYSIDDLDKLKWYHFNELISFDKTQRYQLIREGRPCKMEWLIGIPKSDSTEGDIGQFVQKLNPLNIALEINWSHEN